MNKGVQEGSKNVPNKFQKLSWSALGELWECFGGALAVFPYEDELSEASKTFFKPFFDRLR